ncbi:MAG: glycosyltransferase family 4 protein [Ktedonobacteraceae bacterium]|nr:glycosyltransferase family 4 protein [Ktedonobacteraceae bacterium]
MRILMIAPQPFMEPRGVPFSVYYHIKVLTTLGHTVDLVTYPQGKRITLPGLHIYRVPRLPFIREVKVGPSLAKLVLDVPVFLLATWRLCLRRYRYLHTHEEAGFMGTLLAPVFGCKHMYYMHSDLAQQTVSSGFTKNALLLACVATVQRLIARKADAIVAICPDIETTARRLAPARPVYMIENVAVDEALPAVEEGEAAWWRTQLRLGAGPIVLYTGTLESYQGIDLLLRSVAAVRAEFPTVRYVIVGGQQEQVAKLWLLAEHLGVAETVRFVGQRPLEEMPSYMAMADVLVSPRSKGTNTPLKLYTYLRSGKPVLATDILSHTQILSSDVTKLVPATPEGLAEGALALLRDPEQARILGARGQQFAQTRYSWPVFFEKSSQAYNEFL